MSSERNETQRGNIMISAAEEQKRGNILHNVFFILLNEFV